MQTEKSCVFCVARDIEICVLGFCPNFHDLNLLKYKNKQKNVVESVYSTQ